MNDKCEVKLPKIEKKEKDVVRRTGIGRTICIYAGIRIVDNDEWKWSEILDY